VSRSGAPARLVARLWPALLGLSAVLLAAAAAREADRAFALERARAALDRADRVDSAAERAADLREARAALERVLGWGAPSPDGLYLAALARSLEGPEEAVPLAEAEALVRRALARNPYHARAHLLLGRLLAEGGEASMRDAERAVRTAARVSPRHKEILETSGEFAVYRAVEAGDPKYVDWAVETFRVLHRLEPVAVTRTLPLLRLFLESTEDLSRAVPDEIHPRLQFASTLMGMGRFEDAMAEYRRADRLEPEGGQRHEAHGLAQWGRLLVWRGDWEAGAARLLEAERLQGEAFADDLELARALLRSGRASEARPVFVRAIRRAGRSEEKIALLLGDVRAAQVEERALVWIAEALPGVAWEPWRSFLRGRLRLLGGERVAAREEFLRSLRREKDPRAYAELARLSLDLGEFEEAGAYAERALLYDPSNADYASLLEESRRRTLYRARKAG
jgi:tetratricopeptide (TPR) repeat protein